MPLPHLPAEIVERILSEITELPSSLRGTVLAELMPVLELSKSSISVQEGFKQWLRGVRNLEVGYPHENPADPQKEPPVAIPCEDRRLPSRTRTLIRLINDNLQHISLPRFEKREDLNECIHYVIKYCRNLQSFSFVDHGRLACGTAFTLAKSMRTLRSLQIISPSVFALTGLTLDLCTCPLKQLNLQCLGLDQVEYAMEMLEVRGGLLESLEISTRQYGVPPKEEKMSQDIILDWFLQNANIFLPQLKHFSITVDNNFIHNNLYRLLQNKYLRRMSLDIVDDLYTRSFPRRRGRVGTMQAERMYFSVATLTRRTFFENIPDRYRATHTLKLDDANRLARRLQRDHAFRHGANDALLHSNDTLTCLEVRRTLEAVNSCDSIILMLNFILPRAPMVKRLILPYPLVCFHESYTYMLHFVFENAEEVQEIRLVWSEDGRDVPRATWARKYLRLLRSFLGILEPHCPKLRVLYLERGHFFPPVPHYIGRAEIMEAVDALQSFEETRRKVDLRSLKLQLQAWARFIERTASR